MSYNMSLESIDHLIGVMKRAARSGGRLLRRRRMIKKRNKAWIALANHPRYAWHINELSKPFIAKIMFGDGSKAPSGVIVVNFSSTTRVVEMVDRQG